MHADDREDPSTPERLLAWVGPDPRRVDSARVTLGDGWLTARGASLAPDHTLEYALDTALGWVTRRLSVRTSHRDWWRTLELSRTEGGIWSATRSEASRGDPAAPVTVELDGLEDALDCDLGLCPLTNTMPVLRHDLVRAARNGDDRARDFVMAWVSVPDLTVHASRQRYTPAGRADGGDVHIRFASDGFATTITFDGDGLVRHYPDLAARMEPVPQG